MKHRTGKGDSLACSPPVGLLWRLESLPIIHVERLPRGMLGASDLWDSADLGPSCGSPEAPGPGLKHKGWLPTEACGEWESKCAG